MMLSSRRKQFDTRRSMLGERNNGGRTWLGCSDGGQACTKASMLLKAVQVRSCVPVQHVLSLETEGVKHE